MVVTAKQLRLRACELQMEIKGGDEARKGKVNSDGLPAHSRALVCGAHNPSMPECRFFGEKDFVLQWSCQSSFGIVGMFLVG